jgi:hypothetical protein
MQTRKSPQNTWWGVKNQQFIPIPQNFGDVIVYPCYSPEWYPILKTKGYVVKNGELKIKQTSLLVGESHCPNPNFSFWARLFWEILGFKILHICTETNRVLHVICGGCFCGSSTPFFGFDFPLHSHVHTVISKTPW